MRLARIVSGGQSGVDRGALDAALDAGFPCGGWCPPGREAEDGVIPARYPLAEMASGGYRERTIQNILDSDGTLVIYFDVLEGGTGQTVLHCRRRGKPHRLVDGARIAPVDAVAEIADFVVEHRIAVLNVAGPRATRQPQAERYAYELIAALLAEVRRR